MGRGLHPETVILCERILDVFKAEHPNSPRRVAYALHGNQAGRMASKVGKLCGRLIDDGRLDLDWYDDSSRAYVMPNVVEDLHALVELNRSVPDFDPWGTQPHRVVCWSEKSVGGTLKPTLDQYSIPFLNTSGWNSRKMLMEEAKRTQGSTRRLIILYVGDHDACGSRMSADDIPRRMAQYGATNWELRRVAITRSDFDVMQSRGLTDAMKPKDPNRQWYIAKTGLHVGVELETLPAPVLRQRLKNAIVKCIADRPAWQAVQTASAAIRASWETYVDAWPRPQLRDEPAGKPLGVVRLATTPTVLVPTTEQLAAELGTDEQTAAECLRLAALPEFDVHVRCETRIHDPLVTKAIAHRLAGLPTDLRRAVIGGSLTFVQAEKFQEMGLDAKTAIQCIRLGAIPKSWIEPIASRVVTLEQAEALHAAGRRPPRRRR